jgi:hypothetical protein
MAGEPGEQLTERRNYVVVLSLLIDQHQQLIQGELADPISDTRMRFVGWRGLVMVLRAWLRTIEPYDQHPNAKE